MFARFKGWKTHAVALATVLLGIGDLLDPNLMTTALGLDQRGHAILILALGVTMALLREMTHTPPRRNQP